MPLRNHIDYSRLNGTIFARSEVEELTAVVAGAGGLGNEVSKGLGLLGVRRVVVVDPDSVHSSNLTRSVLFRHSDCLGRNKAECLAEAAIRLFPDTQFNPFPREIADVGFGDLANSHILFSCVDSDLARLEIAYISTTLAIPVCDAGLGAPNYSHGRVSWFAGKAGACFGCKLTPRRRSDLLTFWDASVRPCSDLPVPHAISSTPTMAAIVGSLQVELGLRWLMQQQMESVTFEISLDGEARSQYFRTPQSSSCPLHESAEGALIALPYSDAPLDRVLASVRPPPGCSAYIALDWPVCTRVRCLECHWEWPPMRRTAVVRRSCACPSCGSTRVLELETIRTIERHSAWAELTPAALSLPENHRFRVKFSGERI